MLTILVVSCSQKSGTSRDDNTADMEIRNQVILLAEDYAMNQLKEAERTVAENGAVTISDQQNKYIIEPVRVFFGLIDNDPETDAIVSIAMFKGQYQDTSRHLVFLKTNGKFELAGTIQSDMDILWIRNRIITADVPTHSRNSPLFNCESCRDVIDFQFREGSLVRVK